MEASGTTAELRPLGLGEILDAAFKVYKAHFKTLCLCVVFVVVPLAILSTLLTLSADPSAFDPSPDAADDATFGGAQIAALIITVVLAVLLSTLATAACTRAVAAAYIGQPVDWRQSLRFGFRKIIPLILLSVLTGLAVVLGLFALLIGAIYVGIRLVLGSPALVVEDESATGAMSRSWSLVKDRWWSTFGVVVVSTLLILVIGGLIQGLLALPGALGDSTAVGAILNTIGQIVSNVITIPLQAAVLTILYFDLRVRKEGFDLALLSEGVGGGTAPQDVARSAGIGGDQESSGGFERPSDTPPASTGGFERPRAAPAAGTGGSERPPAGAGGFSAPTTSGDPLDRPPEGERDRS